MYVYNSFVSFAFGLGKMRRKVVQITKHLQKKLVNNSIMCNSLIKCSVLLLVSTEIQALGVIDAFLVVSRPVHNWVTQSTRSHRDPPTAPATSPPGGSPVAACGEATAAASHFFRGASSQAPSRRGRSSTLARRVSEFVFRPFRRCRAGSLIGFWSSMIESVHERER